MADFFVLNEEIIKLQDSCYTFPNEVSINDLEASEIDRLLIGKHQKFYYFENFFYKR